MLNKIKKCSLSSSSTCQNSSTDSDKIVVAVHSYQPDNESTDLIIKKGEEFIVIDQTIKRCPGWWKVKNKQGRIGLIPSNYVVERKIYQLHQFKWFLPHLDRDSAEHLLKSDSRDGAFIVRLSTSQELYTISLLVKNGSKWSIWSLNLFKILADWFNLNLIIFQIIVKSSIIWFAIKTRQLII